MTQHEDSLAALRSRFGADLEAAQARHRGGSPAPGGAPRKRPRLRLMRVVAGASAVALAGTVAVLAIGGAPAEQLGAVAEAEAALAPQPGILHIRATASNDATLDGKPLKVQGQEEADRFGTWERWSTADGSRWRLSARARTASPTTPGEPTSEQDFAGGEQRSLYRWLERMEVITDIPKRVGGDSEGAAGLFGGDVDLSDLRQLFADGKLLDRGIVEIDGRRARQLRAELAPSGEDNIATTFDYFVDPETFRPVRTEVRTAYDLTRGPDAGKQTEMVQRTDIHAYETLKSSPALERQLRFDVPPGTEVLTRGYRKSKTVRTVAK